MFIIVGLLGLAISIAAFWYCLPRHGRLMPLVNTVWEPYIVIIITMGTILSLGALAVGVVDLFV